MRRSGLADSPFFTVPTPVAETVEKKRNEKKLKESTQSGNQESMQASNRAIMQALKDESIIELICKAVKGTGKESATYRFTPEEKKALLELTRSEERRVGKECRS